MPTPTSQNATYIGVNLQDILYGIQLVLYFQTIHAVLTLRKRRRADAWLMVLSTVMVLLITVWIAACGVFGEEAWVIHGTRPGGADAYWRSTITGWYLDLARAAIFVLQLMTDALLIFRCWAMWSNAVIIIIPSILWFGSLVLGVLQTWILSSHAGRFAHSISSRMALAYFAVSIFLNTTLTSLICYRLIRHGKLVRSDLGQQFSLVYFAVAEITVESALPFTLSGIVFLVTLGLGLEIMVPFSWVYFMMTCISPQMLILRVLQRRNAPRDTSEPPSNVEFHQWSRVPVRRDEPEVGQQRSSILHFTDPGDAASVSGKDVVL